MSSSIKGVAFVCVCMFANNNKEHMPITADEEIKFTTQNLTNLTTIWERTNGCTVIKW